MPVQYQDFMWTGLLVSRVSEMPVQYQDFMWTGLLVSRASDAYLRRMNAAGSNSYPLRNIGSAESRTKYLSTWNKKVVYFS